MHEYDFLFFYEDGRFDIESVIEKLPAPDELPSRMSADQIANIDKLFDSLAQDYTAPAVSAGMLYGVALWCITCQDSFDSNPKRFVAGMISSPRKVKSNK